jgi:hypothetical protein
MAAHFSSRLKEQINATLVVILLAFCTLGTHWVGYAHSVSHAAKEYQTHSISNTPEADVAFSHSSDVCHLLDALSLAGFVPQSSSEGLATSVVIHHLASKQQFHFAETSALAYQSRAPPTPLI